MKKINLVKAVNVEAKTCIRIMDDLRVILDDMKKLNIDLWKKYTIQKSNLIQSMDIDITAYLEEYSTKESWTIDQLKTIRGWIDEEMTKLSKFRDMLIDRYHEFKNSLEAEKTIEYLGYKVVLDTKKKTAYIVNKNNINGNTFKFSDMTDFFKQCDKYIKGFGSTETKTYRYTYKLRGFSLGCQPMKDLIKTIPDKEHKFEVIEYSRKLTQEEINNYELVDLN